MRRDKNKITAIIPTGHLRLLINSVTNEKVNALRLRTTSTPTSVFLYWYFFFFVFVY